MAYTSPIGSGFTPDFSSTFGNTTTPAVGTGGSTAGAPFGGAGAAIGGWLGQFNPFSTPTANAQSYPATYPGGAPVGPTQPAGPAAPTAPTAPVAPAQPQGTSMPAQGTAGYNSSQGTSYNGDTGTVTAPPQTGYGVTTPTTIPSNVIGSGNTYSDVLNARNSMLQDYTQASNQYAQDYAANMSNTLKAQYSGDTMDYGSGAASLYRAEAAPQLVADQMRAGNALQAAQLQQGLALGQNQQVAPGSTLVNQFTGQSVYQGQGASPQTIMGTAASLYQAAVSSGSVQYNPDGSVNMQPYIQQAQQMYSQYGGGGGQQGGASQQQGGAPGTTGGSTPATGNGTVPAYSGNGQSTPVPYQGQPDGQPQGYGANGYGNVEALPPALRSYVQNVAFTNADGSVTSLPFISSDRVPSTIQPVAQAQSAKAGIPYLDSTGGNAVLAAQQIIDVVNSAEALSIRNLQPGTAGRLTDAAVNWANNWLQFNPDLSNFNQLKDAASKATTALAGGVGSGFRMNMGIINAATENMPTASDNLETAMTKAEALRGQIINAIAPLYPQLRGKQIFTGSLSSSNPTGTGSTDTSSFSGSAWQ